MRKGKERKGTEKKRKGKERKGAEKERKGEERKEVLCSPMLQLSYPWIMLDVSSMIVIVSDG